MRLHTLVTDPDAIRVVLGEPWWGEPVGVVMPIGDEEPAGPEAIVLGDDIFDEEFARRLDRLRDLRLDRIVLYTGSLAREPWARDVANWGSAGMRAFDEASARIRDALAGTPKRVLWRPHARHIISDAQRGLALMRQLADDGLSDRFGLALDPSALLEPTMLPTAEDHLARAFEALAPLADLVFLTGARGRTNPASLPEPEQWEGGPPVEQVPAHRSDIDPALLGRLFHEHARGDPVIFAEDAGAQLEALGMLDAKPGC